ncbi:MAG: hypothetical protein Q8S73_37075 [Deltaproteobacteria bacterium]|nr:hypothetical protein [Myxococcales bacterium]MDP3219774.1 hypothetical protein [Deltaproteobacteria bacterium]
MTTPHTPVALPADELAAIGARAEAATPWTPAACDLHTGEDGPYALQGATIGGTLVTLGDTYEGSTEDWLLIAHARTDVPALLRHIAALDAAHAAAVAAAVAAETARCGADEQARFARWLRLHDEGVTAWEAATELQECAWPMELLSERTDPPSDTISAPQSFTLTIGGEPVRMDVAHVDRVLDGRRELFWSTRVHTKSAGLRTYDHHHSGNSRMEAIGWTLQVLAGEGMEPSAMTWGADAIAARAGAR